MSRIIELDAYYQAHPQVMNSCQNGTIGFPVAEGGEGRTSLFSLGGSPGSTGEYTGTCLGFYPPSTGDAVRIIGMMGGSQDSQILTVNLLGTFEGGAPYLPHVSVSFTTPIMIMPSQWYCISTGTSTHLFNYGGQVLEIPVPNVSRCLLIYDGVYPQLGDRISILHNSGPSSGSVSETILSGYMSVTPQPVGEIADLAFDPPVTTSVYDSIMVYSTGSGFDSSAGSSSLDIFAESSWRSERMGVRFSL